MADKAAARAPVAQKAIDFHGDDRPGVRVETGPDPATP